MSYMYYCMVRWKSDPLFRYLKEIVPAKKDDHNLTRAVHLFTVQCGGQYSTLAGLETCNHVLVPAQHGNI